MAKRINHLKRYRRLWGGGVVTWCGLTVEKAAPFWILVKTCKTCVEVRDNSRNTP